MNSNKLLCVRPNRFGLVKRFSVLITERQHCVHDEPFLAADTFSSRARNGLELEETGGEEAEIHDGRSCNEMAITIAGHRRPEQKQNTVVIRTRPLNEIRDLILSALGTVLQVVSGWQRRWGSVRDEAESRRGPNPG